MHEHLYYCDATDLATLVRSKQVSPIEITRAHLDRIQWLNPRLNAVVTLNESAMEEARAAEAALMRGESLGPLHGVPFTAKDSLDTAGLRTVRGSRLFSGYVPTVDASAVARVKAAGGIVLGKTNVPEFSFARESENAVFGRTVNPWNPQRTPGGSTGGEAAAIAAGLSPLGLGSDVAISIRGPAHYCGVVGLKATHGRIPLTGHWPNSLRRFWHVGPLARSIRDAALALSILAGPDGQDGYALPLSAPAGTLHLDRLREYRVGWMATKGFGPVDPDVIATVARAADVLQRLGCEVVPVELPNLEQCDGNILSATLFGCEAMPYFRRVVAGRERELHTVMAGWMAAPPGSLEEFLAAEREVEALRDEFAGYFQRHDALLCPVVPLPAHEHGAGELTIGNMTVPQRHVVRATVPFNLTGHPAVSVPFGSSGDGLPIGVQLVGRHFDERTILTLGAALETETDAGDRRPIP
jgi:Asp-tRNA(Asn)/Glu-tRNA(Gln) amidotransferase A subunit family amidase